MSTPEVPSQPAVLLAIDCPETLHSLETRFQRLGCLPRSVSRVPELAEAASQGGYSLVVTSSEQSLLSPRHIDSAGWRMLSATPTVYVSRSGSFEDAAAAARAGACDVLRLPIEDSSLLHVVQIARAHHEQLRARALRGEQLSAGPRPANGATARSSGDVESGNGLGSQGVAGIAATRPASGDALRLDCAADARSARQLESTLVGLSAEMDNVRRLVAQVSRTEAAVVIHGPSGTGKQWIAREIHRLSRRHQGAFVAVSLGAIPTHLFERELFGEQQAPQVAAGRGLNGPGPIAHGGTLFLEDVDAADATVQPRLLRLVQEGVWQRTGFLNVEPMDVRILSATRRDPRELVRAGSLREDFYFGLCVVSIHVSPLCERPEDVQPLAEHFLQRSAARNDKPVIGFTPNAMRILEAYDWPGNAAELENAVEKLVVFSRGRFIGEDEIPIDYYLTDGSNGNGAARSNRGNGQVSGVSGLGARLTPIQRHERAAIVEALERVEGNVVRAAELLGLGQATVYRKIKLYGVSRPRKRHSRPI